MEFKAFLTSFDRWDAIETMLEKEKLTKEGRLNFWPGDAVELTGLKSASATRMNGRRGVIREYDPEKDRFCIDLGDEKPSAVKARNLELISTHAEVHESLQAYSRFMLFLRSQSPVHILTEQGSSCAQTLNKTIAAFAGVPLGINISLFRHAALQFPLTRSDPKNPESPRSARAVLRAGARFIGTIQIPGNAGFAEEGRQEYLLNIDGLEEPAPDVFGSVNRLAVGTQAFR